MKRHRSFFCSVLAAALSFGALPSAFSAEPPAAKLPPP